MTVPPPPLPQMYQHFDVLVGLAWSNYPDKYTHGSLAIGRVYQARQATGDGPDKRGTLVFQVWGWAQG